MLLGAASTTAWCPTCRRHQPVADQYLTDSGDALPRFVEYVATPLECGHDANDAPPPPRRSRFVPDPTLVQRVVALQQAARAGRVS